MWSRDNAQQTRTLLPRDWNMRSLITSVAHDLTSLEKLSISTLLPTMSTPSSVRDTCDAINAACKAKGGAYASYSCKSVSWDDVQRGTVGGSLSCWGGNITDTRLWEKSGTLLYTCRSDNWNEKLGKVDADSVAVVVGNHKRPSRSGEKVALEPITLKDFLQNTGMYASYSGVNSDTDLYDENLDSEISIRFQTTFLPVEDSELSTLEFCTEAYNYNTMSDDDPRNAVLLCTTQGIAFQQDGAGSKKLFHHAVDETGKVHRYWLEAERSKHKVGGSQKETKEEAMSAVARGKATASVIGIEAMGTRFNVLMTVQIPLEQKPKVPTHRMYYQQWEALEDDLCMDMDEEQVPSMLCSAMASSPAPASFGVAFSGLERFKGSSGTRQSKIGKANAARVSRGTEVDVWDGVNNKEPKRDKHQHITVTVVIYNTVAGGVPSAQDVEAAIEDMERLYEACNWKGRLAESGANFMKSELTVSESKDIAKKIKEQPYGVPECGLVKNAGVFPRSSS